MADNDISRKKETFGRLLSLGRIHDAVKLLRGMTEQKMAWEITDEINRVESSYRYLLKYASEGVDDPSREAVYGSIVDELLVIFDRFARFVGGSTGNAAYFGALRRCGQLSVAEAAADCMKAIGLTAIDFGAAEGRSVGSGSLSEAEARAATLFDRVWTAFPLSSDDASAIWGLLTDDAAPAWLRQLIASAVILGNNDYFDSRRVEILCRLYGEHTDRPLALTALTGLLLTLSVNRLRPLSPRLEARLAALRDVDSWRGDIKMIWLELIRTRDTDRIARKIKDEVVPGMLKIKPEVDKTFDKARIEELDIADLEENPQWQELLEKSGLADRLRELTELQQEGADVMMGTFAHLKSFPFFSSVSNWFLPFYSGHSSVAAIGEDAAKIAAMVQKARFMCDNDKYSFILALGSVGKEQRLPMLSQLKSRDMDVAELEAEATGESASGREIVSRYVRNLYRFYKLYSRRDGFRDPLGVPPDLTAIPTFAPDASDDDTVRLAAEFYFNHGYHREALPLFLHAEKIMGLDSQLFQKIGYCYQKLGDMRQALDYYEKSELLDASSSWTLKRIAACRRLLDDWSGALDYYRRVDAMEPDNVATLRQIGDCQMRLGRHDDAVKTFYKVCWLDDDSPRSLRRLAWAQLMSGDRAKAETHMLRLAGADYATADDLLNLGHLRLSEGQLGKAAEDYARFIMKQSGNPTALINAVRADTPSLLKLGVRPDLIALAIDAAIYRSEEMKH